MRTDRPYRKAKSQEEALRELQEMSGAQYDPGVVRAFMAVVRKRAKV